MNTNSEKFSIDVIGDVTGNTWKGVFQAKIRLGKRDELRQDELRRELLGANPSGATPRAQNIAEVYSFCMAHIMDAPQWWKMNADGLDLEDDNVAGAVYDNIVRLISEADQKLKAQTEAAKAELSKE